MDDKRPQFRAIKAFEEVPRLEVKRCYVAAQYFRNHGRGNTRYLRELTRAEFAKRLEASKKYAQKLTELELDASIREEYPKRLKMYNACQWYVGTISPDEVGVWKRAGGLPVEWTYDSLADTAARVKLALDSDAKLPARARRAIPRITPNLDLIEQEPYLYPIITPGATMGRGRGGVPREHFQRMKGDIDDGCMRSITLTMHGRTEIRAYVGVMLKVS
jgi:hypothetical protein